jgi:probable rRNA maturation factor
MLQLLTDIEGTFSDLPLESDLLLWATSAIEKPGKWEISLRIVDRKESQALNRDYRGKDQPTNVISFPFELPPGLSADMLGDEAVPLGDLVICAPLVREEALMQGKPETSHWAHLLIHGILHLQGYDHVLDKDAEVMENLETRLLATLGIADPYA